jgi:hypothetical protein
MAKNCLLLRSCFANRRHTVGNPTFAARPCRGHRAVPAKKLVRKFGARHATLVVDENMTSQVSFRFCLFFL